MVLSATFFNATITCNIVNKIKALDFFKEWSTYMCVCGIHTSYIASGYISKEKFFMNFTNQWLAICEILPSKCLVEALITKCS